VIVLALLLLAPFLLLSWVHGDGIGYVAILRSAVVDRDLRLANEFDYLSTHIESDARGFPARFLSRSEHRPGVDPVYQTPRPDPVTGRVPAIYSVGPALAWTPAYTIAHALTRRLDGPGAASGYGGLYYLAIALTSLALGAAGLVLTRRLAALHAGAGDATWATLAMAFATPLLYYLYLAPSYSHALTVFTTALFLAHATGARGDRRVAAWFVRGGLVGLMFLAHWNDVVIALPFLAIEALRSAHGRDGLGVDFAALLLAALAGAIGFALVAMPQFAAWQYFHGRPWVRHPSEYLGFRLEGVWGTLFSARHGLLTWTPVLALSIAGLFRLSRRDRELALGGLAALLLLVISNAMVRDWWGGSAFGMRRMISATPLFAIGLAALFADLRAAWSKRAVTPALVAAFSLWNVLLVAQYSLGMISHTDAVSFRTLAANQPRVIGRLAALARKEQP
jgi:hypothetical protein